MTHSYTHIRSLSICSSSSKGWRNRELTANNYQNHCSPLTTITKWSTLDILLSIHTHLFLCCFSLLFFWSPLNELRKKSRVLFLSCTRFYQSPRLYCCVEFNSFGKQRRRRRLLNSLCAIQSSNLLYLYVIFNNKWIGPIQLIRVSVCLGFHHADLMAWVLPIINFSFDCIQFLSVYPHLLRVRVYRNLINFKTVLNNNNKIGSILFYLALMCMCMCECAYTFFSRNDK